jgi:hypothetical protein
VKKFVIDPPHLLHAEEDSVPEAAESIPETAPEIDGRGFGEVAGRTRHFTDAKAVEYDLCQNLIIKDEVVVILLERKSLKHSPGKSAVPGVIFRKF